MKKLLKILLAFGLSAQFCLALELENIPTNMDTNIKKVLSILEKLPPKSTSEKTRNKEQIEQVAKEVFNIFDPIFDYDLISQLALASHYKTLSNEQKSEFKAIFISNLKRDFTDKLQLYKDEKLEVVEGKKIKENRYNLKTSILLDGKENFVIFKFYPKAQNDWRIYDIDVLGISIIQTYRSQIGDILSKNDFKTLLEKLQGEIKFE